MSYIVEVKFKHIEHARAFVNKHEYSSSPTIRVIAAQVRATFPRDIVPGSTVRMLSTPFFSGGDVLAVAEGFAFVNFPGVPDMHSVKLSDLKHDS